MLTLKTKIVKGRNVMKKSDVMIIVSVCFILFAASIVKAEDGYVDQLSNELQREGAVTSEEARALEPSIKEMIKDGESKQDVKNAISQAAAEAHAQGLKGKDVADKVHSAIQKRKLNKTQNKKKSKKEKGKSKKGKK